LEITYSSELRNALETSMNGSVRLKSSISPVDEFYVSIETSDLVSLNLVGTVAGWQSITDQIMTAKRPSISYFHIGWGGVTMPRVLPRF
jgi:hypothetical protein